MQDVQGSGQRCSFPSEASTSHQGQELAGSFCELRTSQISAPGHQWPLIIQATVVSVTQTLCTFSWHTQCNEMQRKPCTAILLIKRNFRAAPKISCCGAPGSKTLFVQLL